MTDPALGRLSPTTFNVSHINLFLSQTRNRLLKYVVLRCLLAPTQLYVHITEILPSDQSLQNVRFLFTWHEVLSVLPSQIIAVQTWDVWLLEPF